MDLKALKPDLVLIPMDRSLGPLDFEFYEQHIIKKSKKREYDLTGSLSPEKDFQSCATTWELKTKKEYVARVCDLKIPTCIVNALNTDHLKGFGGSLYIDGEGSIIHETPYGSDSMATVESPELNPRIEY